MHQNWAWKAFCQTRLDVHNLLTHTLYSFGQCLTIKEARGMPYPSKWLLLTIMMIFIGLNATAAQANIFTITCKRTVLNTQGFVKNHMQSLGFPSFSPHLHCLSNLFQMSKVPCVIAALSHQSKGQAINSCTHYCQMADSLQMRCHVMAIRIWALASINAIRLPWMSAS